MATEFQQRVYHIVKKIPRGKVLTYKQVAEKLGDKKLARAVGNALNKNLASQELCFGCRRNKNRDKQVPCHRVIRSDGKIGGYAKGGKMKIIILKKEGVKIKKSRLI